MATKNKKTKKGATVSKRAADIALWVEKYERKANASRTSEVIAEMASKELGFEVSPNRVARELQRRGIAFRRTDVDPPAPHFSKVELVRAQLRAALDRIASLETKVFGKAVKDTDVDVPQAAKPRAKAVKAKGGAEHKNGKAAGKKKAGKKNKVKVVKARPKAAGSKGSKKAARKATNNPKPVEQSSTHTPAPAPPITNPPGFPQG